MTAVCRMNGNASRQRLAEKLRELERQNFELGQTLHLVEEARSHYADHYDFAPFGCLTLDSHGCICEINIAAARLLGRERARLIETPFFLFIEKPHLPAFLQHLRACKRSNEKVVSEVAIAGKGRAHRLVELSSVPVIDARSERTVYRTMLADVTERRRAEKALRRSEERFSTAFRASPSANAISTLAEGRFIDVNASFCKLTGYRRSEVIDRTVLELGIHEDPTFRETMIRELRATRTFQNREGRFRTKSGATCDVLVSAEIIELESQECILIIAQDVSDLKRLQREVIEIGEREKRRIGRDLHDDTCQTLAGIAMLAEVSARRLASRDPKGASQVREIANLLKQNIEQVRRLSAGLSPVRVQRYGLAWALRELAIETSERCDIDCRFAMSQPIAIADENIATHLYRIAQEALSNAIRHGRASKIVLELKVRGKTGKLTVSDDGCGFPHKPHKGGLGLHTMRDRASLIGGTLGIDNHAKRGTVVTCSFPQTGKPHAHKTDGKEADIPR